MQIEEADARIAMWQDLWRMEGWRELVKFLEQTYAETGMDTPDSVKGVAARNAKLTLIRSIFRFVKHDFNERDALLKELRVLNDFDDQIPTSI